MSKTPCGRTIGHGQFCVEGYLCEQCEEVRRLEKKVNGDGPTHGAPETNEPQEVVKHFLQDGINSYVECKLCAAEVPPATNMRDYSWLGAGFTSRGFQVMCMRHGINVLHLDFEGRTLKGSGNSHPQDYLVAAQAAPRILEETTWQMAAAGFAVAKARMTTYSQKPAVVLRAYSCELRAYLASLEVGPDWKVAHDAMTGEGTRIITAPGVRGE